MKTVSSQLANLFRSLVRGANLGALAKAERRYVGLRSRIIDVHLGEAVDSLWTRLSLPPSERPCLQRAQALARVSSFIEQRMEGIAAIEFQLAVPSFLGAEAHEVVKSAPSPEGIDAWIKAAQVDVKAFAAGLLADPASFYPTAGLEWLLAKEAPPKLGTFLELLLREEPRPRHFVSPKGLLTSLLEVDTKAIWLEATLRAVTGVPQGLDQFVHALTTSPKAQDRALRNLPTMIEDRQLGTISCGLAEKHFQELSKLDGAARYHGCGQLARFTADLLLVPRPGPNLRELLKRLAVVSKALRITATSKELQEVTWLLESMETESPPPIGALGVNLSGARQVVNALVNIEHGTPPLKVLEALSRNVGLEPVSEPGCKVSYDPKLHEDTVGGALPGEVVEVLRKGWRFDHETILRATVKPLS